MTPNNLSLILSAPLSVLILGLTGSGWGVALIVGAILAGLGIVDLARRI